MSPERDEETADGAAMREQLRHVYRIGGGSGDGKSTVARHIGARHGLRLHTTDDVIAEHARRHEKSRLKFDVGTLSTPGELRGSAHDVKVIYSDDVCSSSKRFVDKLNSLGEIKSYRFFLQVS